MRSIAQSLLGFVDPEAGPVTAITSAPFPTPLGDIWYSVARLHERWRGAEDSFDALEFAGGGWSPDRETSQCKAVTEALERWAVRYYARGAPQDAALDADPTSNGFAALPVAARRGDLERIAYCEALERWALARVWDRGDLSAAEIRPEPTAATRLLAGGPGEPRYFESLLLPHADAAAGSAPLRFVLCLVELPGGGVLPGSACGTDRAGAADRAACEARVHADALARLRRRAGKPPTHVIERRLLHFGEAPDGFQKVLARLRPSSAATTTPAPPPVFSRRLAGPWDDAVAVHRVLVAQDRGLNDGGDERFII